MRFGPWVIYLLVVLLLLTLAGLGAGGYVFYRQHLALERLVKDTRRLRLSTQGLESMLAERAGWSPPGAAPPPPEAPPAPKPATKAKAAARSDKPPPDAARSTPPTTSPPPPAAAPPEASDAASAVSEKSADSKPGSSAPEKAAEEPAQASAAQNLEPEPESSDWVTVRNIQQKKVGNTLVVSFQVASKQEGKKQVEGYVSVILRGERHGSPWLEAWPPARLTLLGRPQNYKRGAPFSVRRYRTMKARFAVVDKDLQRLEFLIYDQQGELAMVLRTPVTIKPRKS